MRGEHLCRDRRIRALVPMLLIAGAAPLLSAPAASAQQGTTEIRGRVTDAQEAALPAVSITLRNQESGMFRETLTNEEGTYFVTSVTPGVYELTVRLSGFKTVTKRDLRLEIGRTATYDVTLDVGGVEEVVNVAAEPPLVDASSKEVGGVISTRELTELPTINRNYIGFVGLLPGIIPNISTESFGSDSINVNGLDSRNNNYMLDGANNNDDVIGQRAGTQARTPLESIQEFQVLTNQYDAEFGRTTGAVINAVSKQGTNAFRGSAFTFAQDADLTAKDYFAKQNNLDKPDTKQQWYGGTVGGPILKNKAHFFFSVERLHIDEGVTVVVPARPELNATTTEQTRVWNTLLRGDHQINANHTWGVRWLREYSPQLNQLIPLVGTNPVTLAASREEDDLDQTVVGSLSSVFGNSRVNTMRVSWTQEDVAFANPAFNSNGRQQILLEPTLNFQTYSDQQNSVAQARINNGYQIEDTFSWFVPGKRGDHDIKFGAQYQVPASNDAETQDNLNGTFTFGLNNGPFNASDPRTYPDRFSIRVPGAVTNYTKAHFVSAFAQDKWKMNDRLTLSLGLRYDLEVQPVPELDNPQFASVDDYPVDYNNLSPRLGFAYNVGGHGNTVVRGGYGTFYDKTHFELIGGLYTAGVYSTSFTATFPANAVDSGPRNGQLPTDPFLVNGPVVNRELLEQMFPAGSRIKNTGTVNLDNPARRIPYTHQITVGVERQLASNLSGSVDYVRTMARDQFMIEDLNPGLRDTTAVTNPLRARRPQLHRRGQHANQRGEHRLRRAAAADRKALQPQLQHPRLVHAVLLTRQHVGRRRARERIPGPRRSQSRPQRGADERQSASQLRRERHGARAEDGRPERELGGPRAERTPLHHSEQPDRSRPERHAGRTASGRLVQRHGRQRHHRRQRGRAQWRVWPGLLPARHAHRLPGSAAAQPAIRRLRGDLQRDQPREFRQPVGQPGRAGHLPHPPGAQGRRSATHGATRTEVHLLTGERAQTHG